MTLISLIRNPLIYNKLDKIVAQEYKYIYQMLNIIALAILPLTLASTSYSKAESFVQTNGASSSVYNEITVSTNGEETKVISNEAGEIKVTSENGKVSITTSPEIKPTIVKSTVKEITPVLTSIEENATQASQPEDENIKKIEQSVPQRALDFLKKLVLKCSLLIEKIYKR